MPNETKEKNENIMLLHYTTAVLMLNTAVAI
jgi:hypothetical protein